MTTLREAIEQGKLDQFIAEHPEVKGDMEAFNRTVEAMSGKSKEAPQAWSQSVENLPEWLGDFRPSAFEFDEGEGFSGDSYTLARHVWAAAIQAAESKK